MNLLKFSKKYLIFVLIILVIVIGMILLVDLKPRKPNEVVNTETNQTGITVKNRIYLTENNLISPRQSQIDNYLNFPDQFSSTQINGQILHLVIYRASLPIDKVQNFGGKDFGKAGVIVFNSKQTIWESSEVFQGLSDDSVEFKDVTGDGVPEIIVIDDGGGNETQDIISVYKWNQNTFELITPEYINPYEGSDKKQGGFKDIDSDDIMDIISFKWDKAYPNLPESDSRFYAKKEIKLIYKFNGIKYVLSKEIPTGVVRNN